MLKTNNGRGLELKAYTWVQIRIILSALHPQLVEIIDELSLSDDYLFFVAEYPFGTDIIKNGKVYFATEGDTIAINDPRLPKIVTDNLGYDIYTGNPFGFVMDKSCEFYSTTIDQRIISQSIAYPGSMLGVVGILNDGISTNTPVFPHNLRSGMKSIFTLASITEAAGIEKLEKYLNTLLNKPNGLQDHGDFLAKIIKAYKSLWRSKILFCSNKFINMLKQKDKSFAQVKEYLTDTHRTKYKIWHRDIIIWNDYFSHVEQKKRLYDGYTPYLSTIKHMYTIAGNGSTGLIPTNDEAYAPIAEIKKILIEGYGLLERANHSPIMMVPAYIQDPGAGDTVYYSSKYPTQPSCVPETKGKSILYNIDMLQQVNEIYKSVIGKTDIKIKLPSLYDAMFGHDFEPYHPDPGTHNNIKGSILLANEDKRFCLDKGCFAEHSQFLLGCFKIFKKKNI
jgi:hypothetical protein